MFKDARLQERLFDQIHAVEFNMEDDYRNAQVGSLLSSGLGDDSFERVDDGETEAETAVREARHLQEAHLAGFNDDAVPDLLGAGRFERVSDDEDSEAEPTPRRGRKVATSSDDASAKKKRTRPPAGASKGAAKKKASSKKSSKKRATDGDESVEGLADSEASVGESQSRAEFATRRGGRRRRRPSKGKQSGPDATADEAKSGANGGAEEVEVLPIVEAPPEVVARTSTCRGTATRDTPREIPQRETPQRPPARDRDQRGSRERSGYRGQSRRDRHQPAITDLLSEGQEILVQIAKEPIAKKGARITSHIALPGRFLVYMPTVEHVGVSRKIESDNERHRLRKLIQTIRAEEDIPSGGFIVQNRRCRNQ